MPEISPDELEALADAAEKDITALFAVASMGIAMDKYGIALARRVAKLERVRERFSDRSLAVHALSRDLGSRLHDRLYSACHAPTCISDRTALQELSE